MNNSKSVNKKSLGIIILLILVCILSLAVGIYSTVTAAQSKAVYDENMKTVSIYEKINIADNSGNAFLKPFYEKTMERAEEAKKTAEDAKSQLTKFAVLAGVMYFVSLMMLISFISLLVKANKQKNE